MVDSGKSTDVRTRTARNNHNHTRAHPATPTTKESTRKKLYRKKTYAAVRQRLAQASGAASEERGGEEVHFEYGGRDKSAPAKESARRDKPSILKILQEKVEKIPGADKPLKLSVESNERSAGETR